MTFLNIAGTYRNCSQPCGNIRDYSFNPFRILECFSSWPWLIPHLHILLSVQLNIWMVPISYLQNSLCERTLPLAAETLSSISTQRDCWAFTRFLLFVLQHGNSHHAISCNSCRIHHLRFLSLSNQCALFPDDHWHDNYCFTYFVKFFSYFRQEHCGR